MTYRGLDPEAVLAMRRARLERHLGRPLVAPRGRPMPPERRRFLREEGEELYWNELAWEKLTPRDASAGEDVVEHAFPGFLAFISGLLLRGAGTGAAAGPRTEVVEDIMLFLARRCIESVTSDDEEALCERRLTERLLDEVLYRFYDLRAEEVERLERLRTGAAG